MKASFVVSLFLLLATATVTDAQPNTCNFYAECDRLAGHAQWCETLREKRVCKEPNCPSCTKEWITYEMCMLKKMVDVRGGVIRFDKLDPIPPKDHPDRPPSDE